MHFHEPCYVHPRHLILDFEWLNIPGHVVTNAETSSPPLCRTCGLIPNMHLPNYYETGWINLLDVESSPSKYRPMMISVHLSGWRHFCMLRLSKNSYLDDSAHKVFMIPHTNFEMFDDSTHEYCIHPRWLCFNWILVTLPDLFYTHKTC